MKFTLEHTASSSKARAGNIQTAHGNIQTPIFMPVGTAGTVKGIHQHELENEIKGPNYFRQHLSFISASRARGFAKSRRYSNDLIIGTNPCLPIAVVIRFIP